MNLQGVTPLELGLDATVRLLNQGFSDYYVPIQLDMPAFLHMLVMDGIDLTLSRVVTQDEKPVGIGLIARRGWNSRLAGMAVIPESRRQGAGRWLVERLVEDARQRGDHSLELEVIEDNQTAVRLYESCGFHFLRRLCSYRLDPAPAGEMAVLEEIDVLEAARLVTAYGLPDLPWQLSGESLVYSSSSSRAYRLGNAVALLSNPEVGTVALRSLVTTTRLQQESESIRLLNALFASFPAKVWVVPALMPEASGALLEKAGFQRGELSQFQMRLSLV